MFNINNYKKENFFTITGLEKNVYKENEQGELIDILFSTPIDFINSTNFSFNVGTFENEVIKYLSQLVYTDLTPTDFSVCGDSIQFWVQENEDGYIDGEGEYYSLYIIALSINNTRINENDLVELLPHFGH